jgi:capsular polysaccharide biosynthesis protein
VDLALIGSVLGRYRRLLLVGTAFAILLAVLAVARISFGPLPTLEFRDAEQWESESTLYVSQQGFPVGAAIPLFTESGSGQDAQSVQVGDPNRLATITLLYAQLATGDEVLDRVFRGRRPTDETVQVKAVAAPTYTTPGTLPLLRVTASAAIPSRAVELAARTTSEFTKYLTAQQDKAKIAQENRAVVSVLTRPSAPRLTKARSQTIAVVVFLAVMVIVIGLAFALDNLRRRQLQARQPHLALGPDEPVAATPVEADVAVSAESQAAAMPRKPRPTRKRVSGGPPPANRTDWLYLEDDERRSQ